MTAYQAPLSEGQHGVWVAAQLQQEPLYTIPFAVVFDQPVDPEALGAAFNKVLRAHDVLRTVVRVEGTAPVQIVRPHRWVELEWLDEPADAPVEWLLRREVERSFDLATEEPLFRARAVRLGPATTALLCTVHHLCFDGESVRLFIEDLLAAYDGAATPASDVQYGDVAYWQADRLADGSWDDQATHWRKRLAGLGPPAAPGRDGPGGTGTAGATIDAIVPTAMSRRLDDLAAGTASSKFTVLTAALHVLLHRLTGQRDITVGTVMDQRNPETERLIGLLVNTVVLRVAIESDASFRSVLAAVRGEFLAALDARDLPFERILRDLPSRRVFDVMINYEAGGTEYHGPAGTRARVLGCADHEAKHPLTLYVRDGAELSLRASYQRAHYTDARISALLDQFVQLLYRLVGDPDAPVRDHSLITAASRRVLPDPRRVQFPDAPPLIADSFLATARHYPTRTALRAGGAEWTYAELQARASSVTARLQAAGAGPGDVVAVIGGRGSDMVRAMLGVLLNGGVFMPVDARSPAKRIHELLRRGEARAAIVLTGEDLPDMRVVRLDDEDETGMTPEDVPSRAEVGLDQMAYVYFTSGTTGIPKLVRGRHRGLAQFLQWQAERFDVAPGDRIAQFTAVSFDPFLRDVLLPLTTGATLCIPDEDTFASPEAVRRWLHEEQITILHAVPSLAARWLTAADAPRADALRVVFFAGEPLTDSLIGAWRTQVSGSVQIVNLYGPAETTLAKCYHVVPNRPLPGVQPIGHPIPGAQTLILSPEGRMCGVGEVGEIHLRTPHHALAPGFSSNPYRDDPADLIYNSGDLGRYRPDGCVDILGRRDHQIKVHGVRINPYEIAATVARHNTVNECFVRDWDDSGAVRLAAYVTPRDGRFPDPAELRRWAAEHLPQVMVPAHVKILESLPVTANGKVDRAALPPPGETPPGQGREPATPAESKVCALMAEVLGRSSLYADDDFFERGGHSLLVVQLNSRLEDAFGVRLPIPTLFRQPTAAEIAAAIEAHEPAVASYTPPSRPEIDLYGLDGADVEELLSILEPTPEER